MIEGAGYLRSVSRNSPLALAPTSKPSCTMPIASLAEMSKVFDMLAAPRITSATSSPEAFATACALLHNLPS